MTRRNHEEQITYDAQMMQEAWGISLEEAMIEATAYNQAQEDEANQ